MGGGGGGATGEIFLVLLPLFQPCTHSVLRDAMLPCSGLLPKVVRLLHGISNSRIGMDSATPLRHDPGHNTTTLWALKQE